nr:MAG TPA: hypothetical protein [Caudoviricetes sp.]
MFTILSIHSIRHNKSRFRQQHSPQLCHYMFKVLYVCHRLVI